MTVAKARKRKARDVWLHYQAEKNEWKECRYPGSGKSCAGYFQGERVHFREVLPKRKRGKK